MHHSLTHSLSSLSLSLSLARSLCVCLHVSLRIRIHLQLYLRHTYIPLISYSLRFIVFVVRISRDPTHITYHSFRPTPLISVRLLFLRGNTILINCIRWTTALIRLFSEISCKLSCNKFVKKTDLHSFPFYCVWSAHDVRMDSIALSLLVPNATQLFVRRLTGTLRREDADNCTQTHIWPLSTKPWSNWSLRIQLTIMVGSRSILFWM